jgi:hypothetical protein
MRREAANDSAFQIQSLRAHLCAKTRANQFNLRALLRKLQTQAARAAMAALTGVFVGFDEVFWSVKMSTSPQ